MDGSAADGKRSFFSALILLTVVIRRLQGASGPSQEGASAEEDRQEDGCQEVGQEIGQEHGEESRPEGRQERGPEGLRQEDRQKIGSQIGQEKRQAREIGPEEFEAGKEGWPEALASD
jgi:hypothetical protein